MESVIATVSGYHGTERFKLIKLIAQTGANYVGLMNTCTTHLVCWRFEGKKFDLARQLGTCVISHRWFEDCLKQGKRLPEGPYTMQSGQAAGPISWQLPVVLDIHGKEKALLKKNRKMLSDLSNASDFNEEEDISASSSDIPCSNWSDSLLLNEPDSSSLLLMCSSSKKRHFCNVSGIDGTGRPVRRSRHLVKKSASDNPINSVMLDSHLMESQDPLKDNKPVCVDLEHLSSMIGTSTQELISEIAPIVFEERRETHEPNEDSGEQNNFHISVNSNGSRNCALYHPGTLQNGHCEHTQVKTDFCDVEDIQNEQGNKSHELGEAAGLDSKTGLSCVICWTDFSTTRGVLPCGHRFCYSCIQGWADCMVV